MRTRLILILCAIGALVVVIVGQQLLRPAGPGAKYAHSETEAVYYSGDATEADARAVGATMAEVGHFDRAKPRDVLVSRDGDTAVLSIVVSPGKELEDWIEERSREIGRRVALALHARRMTVRLVDPATRTKREFVLD